MAYRDDITALGADHLWRLDGALTDDVGAATLTNTGMATNTAAICEDATNSVESNGTGDRLAAPATTDIDGAVTLKLVCGWVRFNSVQLPPRSVYREGTTGNQFNLIIWAGNALMLDIVSGSTIAQAYSDGVLQPNRAYHIAAYIGDAGGGNLEFKLFIDGIEQTVANPTNKLIAGTSLGARTAAEWSDPSGATEVGNQTVLINGSTNCRYGFWATWNSGIPTDTQIREELFAKGALPNTTINMASTSETVGPIFVGDVPLGLEVNQFNSSNHTLTLSDVTFDDACSLDIRWTGTGVLTVVNTNGSNAVTAIATGSGSVNVVTPATVTVTGLNAGTEVRYYEAGTTNELAGIENSGTSFAAQVQVNSVDVRLISLDQQIKAVKAVDTSAGDVTLVAGQLFDRQYENN